MPDCHICGENEGLAYTCNACGGKYCSEHRLPESHQCDGLSYTISADGSGRGTVTTSLGGGSGHRAGRRVGQHATNNLTDSSTRWGSILGSVVLVLVVIGLLAALSGGYASAIDVGGVMSSVTGPVAQNTTTTTQSGDVSTGTAQTSTEQTSTSVSQEIDPDAIESAIHDEINRVRQDRGISPLEDNEQVATAAEEHSAEMAAAGTIYHGDIENRYSSCNSMGENVAYTYANENVRTDYNGVVNYHGNETRIAKGLVQGWMHSEGHRENILRAEWSSEGIGVVIDDSSGEIRVYATQGFCA